MSGLQNTVRDEASCRRHGPRRDRRARGPGREGARPCRPGHAPRLNPPLKKATMVSAPRLHTSAAHPPAGDGNQAIKTWPAVSLYLLVAWLAAGGLILLQPITVQHFLRFPQRVFGGPEQGSGDSRGPDRSTPVTRISEQV